MTTLPTVELGVLGPLQARQDGAPVTVPGAKPRAILTMLGLNVRSIVSAEALVELLWGNHPPRTAEKALQTHISLLRRTLGDGVVLTEGAGWKLAGTEVDASRYKLAARMGRDAAAAGDANQAVARFEEALTLWRGTPELPDSQRGVSEKTRWIEGHDALVEDRADALLATGRAAELIGELEAAVAEAPLRERRWGQLMLALYRAGRQGEALAAFKRAQSLLADELGVDPGPDLRRLEAAIVNQDSALDNPVSQHVPAATRPVTFFLTDIEGSTAAWEANADAMAVALARHDELVEQIVTSRGGRLIKTRGEGDATFSVFERPSAAAAAAIELQDAILHEPWALREPMRIRVALHTGEAELRDGDYFGRAVNRAARLRSLAAGGQILCSGATAELVVDSLSDDVLLADLGTRQLKNLARPEHVFELRLETSDDEPEATPTDEAIERPAIPAVLAGPGPFVGRGRELAGLLSTWQDALTEGARAVLIAGEPGVGKTRLAGEWSRQAYEEGAIVVYGRCDEDLGAPYQPFAEALRSLLPCLRPKRLRELRGIEALLPLVPGLSDVLPDLAAPTRADPDTERYASFDAVVALLGLASASAPIVLILDDLHWAAKPTLLLLRHLLRFGEHAHVQIVGTYRSTDLDRSHPLAAMLADLHRDGTVNRIQLTGLDEDDVTTYVAEAGYDDEELARALASVTGGNPFFLIEALHHVDESGGRWDPSTLPQGVREAVSRRLSRLPEETNEALAAAAVVGSRFALDLVERVVEQDLVGAFDEARKAGILIEEPGGYYRFNHALVRQSLLAELASVRRMRLHQRIATTLETEQGADDELLAELAHHYFECAWAGNAAKAVEYCRRAADQAMASLAYEGAADLYDRAAHALEDLDDELPDRDDLRAQLLIARCEALLAAGDAVSARSAVSRLQQATLDSAHLAAWGTCFDGQLSMLIHPERLDEIESAVAAAADTLAELDDPAGEAKAHTVRAGCLARLGRIADCETALDHALTAARRAREHRRVNAVLANAPLAALWGPNPVPRAGGRCLDVVRLLRITTDSPAVEATSMRCQAVLEAFRGRATAGRRMIDSARRTVSELGLRHARMEVEHFAGIVELVADDPAAAEPHLRRACNGFRRMGLDADTAETAALLARTCLALDRDAEADELCSESERLAGHGLRASIAWRAVRAQLLARQGDHDEARRVAEEAVAIAERTDALVDHGDACQALATVLGAAGDTAGAKAAAERAVDLYERKGAAALADKARSLLGASTLPPAPAEPEAPTVEPDNTCVRVGERVVTAINHEDWDQFEQLFAPEIIVESRRKIVGFTLADLSPGEWPQQIRRGLEQSGARLNQVVVAVRGERLALARLLVGTADVSPGGPQDEFLQLYGIDEEGRIALQIWFDVEDIDAAIAELDATHAQFEEEQPKARLENAAARVAERYLAHFATRDWDAMAEMLADDLLADDRRRVVNAGARHGREAEIANVRAIADIGTEDITATVIATRGERLVLNSTSFSLRDWHEAVDHIVDVVEINSDNQISAHVQFDANDVDAAFEELDARYLAGEAAPYEHIWRPLVDGISAINRHEFASATPTFSLTDHRRVPFASGDFEGAIRQMWALAPDAKYRIKAVHALDAHGAVINLVAEGTDAHGNELEWASTNVISVMPGQTRMEVYYEDDLDSALARFVELRPHARRLENAASRMYDRFNAYLATRDWDAMAEMLTDDACNDDRRRVVSGGIQSGRDAQIANLRAVVDVGVKNHESVVIATRGERLALTRTRVSGGGQRDEAFGLEMLTIVEIDTDARIAAGIIFDLDDLDAAFNELDARYLAGEAAAHSHTWSVIVRNTAAFNRRELPSATPDCVNIDHRRGISFAPGDLTAYLRGTWDLTPQTHIYIEAVHRLNDLGAIVAHTAHATSQDGFTAEWLVINLLTVDGDLISRSEMFDETDIDAALAKFDELSHPAPRLENAASRVVMEYLTHFTTRDWDAMAQTLAAEVVTDDRRRVVNAGMRQGRDLHIADSRVGAEVGGEKITSAVIATRGEHLTLNRVDSYNRNMPSDVGAEMLGVAELDIDNRIAAMVLFDVDDVDAAFQELDARYAAGEAAPYAQTWSVIARAYASLNRRELPATTPDWVNIDHQRATAKAPGELTASIRASWELTPDITHYIETVHRLTDLGAVVTRISKGASQQGFDAEWRTIDLFTIEGDVINRCELFDEVDIEAALARFDELNRPAPQLENPAIQVIERFQECFRASDWTAMAEMMTDDVLDDDRRRVISGGIQRGRDAQIANLRAIVDVGVKNMSSTVIATRGKRLVLVRTLFSSGDQLADAFHAEAFGVIEIDDHERIAARVSFDVDDIDAAFEELESRYLAGEAAAHAHTWSTIKEAVAAITRHELPKLTPDWVNIDHRRAIAFAPGEMTAYINAIWDDSSAITNYAESVHRLTDLGAVVTVVASATSQDGVEAEWRMIGLSTLRGDAINRQELFDEADLDAALARFEELHLQTRRLENAASQLTERYWRFFAARNWDAMAALLADDISTDDRRPVVGAGLRLGRDAEIAEVQATAKLGTTNGTPIVIAVRGERLALVRMLFSGRDQRPDAFHSEVLAIVEINADTIMAARVMFDIDDIDAALEELDARYAAGEAGPYEHTWSVIAHAIAAINRRELFPTTPDWVNIDHRPLAAIGSGELFASMRALWELTSDLKGSVEAVHRLTSSGAVFTAVGSGTSREGLPAEWRMIAMFLVEGDLISRHELFDEADIDAALGRFDELHVHERLENAATRVEARCHAYFARRDWDAMAEIMAQNMVGHDRRHVVSSGIRHGRDAEIDNVRAWTDVGVTSMTSDVIAIRGERLVLSRARLSGDDQGSEAFHTDLLRIFEIDADERIVARIAFDLDETDAALEELDARYLAGEGAAHAQTWSVIARTYAAANRHELPELTSDCVNIDHRRARAFAPGDLAAYVDALFDQAPDIRIYIAAVHRLSDLGAVVTHVARGTSQQGFEAEWRDINMAMVDGDLINRSELFDEADIDAALARFDELNQPAPQLENAASQVDDRFAAYFAARDWDAMSELLADDTSTDDRRRVVNAGLRHGRDAVIADWRAIADVGARNIASTVLAIRGGRLALNHVRFSGRDQQPEAAYNVEGLLMVEINADERIVARVGFDVDDIDAAFEELDARYLAGEAAAHAHTWAVLAAAYAAINRRELPPTTPDWVNIDHRRVITLAPGDLTTDMRAAWDQTPDIRYRIEAVHRVSDLGAVVTHASKGTSHEGFDAEWRQINILTVDGDLLNRIEIFDDGALDAALARFGELSPTAPRLEDAASQVDERFWTSFVARDWAAMEYMLADDVCTDDRRRVVGAGIRRGRDAVIADLRAVADVGVVNVTLTGVASRGAQLALSRTRFSGRDQQPEAFHTQTLRIVEIDADERITAVIDFDTEDIDAAFEELDARYLAGEAAAYAHTWSVLARSSAAFNRRERPATALELVDHRRLATIEPGDPTANILAAWDLAPDYSFYIEAVHRLSRLGAVITRVANGTSEAGFEAEWRSIATLTIEGDRTSRCELFDEEDLDAALARFDELSSSASSPENAAMRTWTHIADAFNRRDTDGFLDVISVDARYEDRRKGLRDEGPGRGKVVQALFEAPKTFRLEIESVAVRGARLGLTRDRYRDTGDSGLTITAEHLTLTEIGDDELVCNTVIFDPDDINSAIRELTARWIASGEVEHPEVIEAQLTHLEAANRHDWDALAALNADATYINHRQLAAGGVETIADHMSSIRMMASLVPDLWIEPAEILSCSAVGLVDHLVVKGTSTEGVAIELPLVMLTLMEGDRVTHVEAFDPDQRELALSRFEELNRSEKRSE